LALLKLKFQKISNLSRLLIYVTCILFLHGAYHMLRKAFFLSTIFASAFNINAVKAQDCPNNPDALGTSRVMKVSSSQGPVGLVSYKKTLDLQDKEVVLTFDDGPIPHRTPAVLAALAKECVKATFFTVGTMASAYPKLVQAEAAAGHSIGTHTWSHRYLTQKRNRNIAQYQIGGGLHAANVALADQKESLSPFFRFPGLNHNKRLDTFVAKNGLISMSVDIVADDWLLITPKEVLKRTLARLEQRGRGIILMHDIHNRTVVMLPELLRELKQRGYKVVHIVPDHQETQVALNNLVEPDNRAFQLAMARTRTKLAKLSPLDEAPIAQAPQIVEPSTVGEASISQNIKLQTLSLVKNSSLKQGELAPIQATLTKLGMRGSQ
jgi:peptidoglycan-N-acetylglucosamine deacetylase